MILPPSFFFKHSNYQALRLLVSNNIYTSSWLVWDKNTGAIMLLCDGYDTKNIWDFLQG